jgi:hypothetical protein
MSNNKTVVADAVQSVVAGADPVEVPTWSALNASLIAGGAELICDGNADVAKGLEQIKDAYIAMFKAGGLTFDTWEDGRKRYEAAYVLRCGESVVDPANSANSSWNQTVVPFLKAYTLVKPKSAKAESVEKAAKRAKAAEEAKALAAGRSADDLKEAQLAMYKTATKESIAQAKALDKAIEFVEKSTKAELDGRLSILKKSFRDLAAQIAKLDDESVLADAIVALKKYVPAKS